MRFVTYYACIPVYSFSGSSPATFFNATHVLNRDEIRLSWGGANCIPLYAIVVNNRVRIAPVSGSSFIYPVLGRNNLTFELISIDYFGNNVGSVYTFYNWESKNS